MKAYLALKKPGGKPATTYHFPDPFYDATAACHARTEIDYEHPMLAIHVPDEQRCKRPGCKSKWKSA